ncbi:MAG: FecR domain-containing protein [Chitinophagaceae bacterium]|nr:FecR domain-containing protein [Chitinophagaceae bacterium]
MKHADLLQKYLDGSISPAEMDELFTYIKNNSDAGTGFENILEAAFNQSYNEVPALSRKEHGEILEKMLSNIEQPSISIIPVHRVHFMRRWGWAAAAVLITMVAGTYLWFSKPLSPGPAKTQQEMAINTAPGKKGALLTLADGSQLVLDSAGNGVIAQQPGADISLQKDQLHYQQQDNKTSNAGTAFNTVSTPRGRQYHVTLPDGTRVWLNAASSLHFPVQFPEQERTVTLTGEAYFEVAANTKAPFKVMGGNQEVTVLGTHFNISAYDDEAAVKTTLLEGRIKVSPLSNPTLSRILQPGQQSIVQPGQLNVSTNADLQDVISWKNGQLSMKNLDVKALMRQISRWYDVDVVYEGPLTERHFGGIIDQSIYLSNIIEVLEAGGIRCRLEGKKLFVSSK